MSNIVHVGKHQMTAELICQHLSRSHILPQLLKEIIIDEVLSQWQLSSPKELVDRQVFEQCYHQVAGLAINQGLDSNQLVRITQRTIELQQFKHSVWGHKLGSYYLERKLQLDQVIYHIMQLTDGSIAQELFFRIKSDQKTFPELAFKYSQGLEARDGGKIGPIKIANLHPDIAEQVTKLQPGELSPLFIIGNAYVFIKLEQSIPAQFDDRLRQTLLDELFDKWLQQRIAGEIGLVSLTTNFAPLDFMNDELLVSDQSKLLPDPQTPSDEFVLERGDTGLLLAELETISQKEAPNPFLSAPKIEPTQDNSTASLFGTQEIATKLSTHTSDINHQVDRQKWLTILVVFVTLISLGFAVGYAKKVIDVNRQSGELNK